MGYGYTYKCKKCGHEYSVSSGIGMLYPNICEEELEKIKAGKYGEEWKQASIDCGPNLKIGVIDKTYMCYDCNLWEEQTDITLYKPEEDRDAKRKDAFYYMPEDKGYSAYKKTVHDCPKCGKKMKELKEKNLTFLPCPECGQLNEQEADLIMWD